MRPATRIRAAVLAAAALTAVMLALFAGGRLAPLVRTSGSAAMLFLFAALLIGPSALLPVALPVKPPLLAARRAFGVAAAAFAAWHTYLSFFEQLGGWNGIAGLPVSFRMPVLTGFIALFILLLLALLSTDAAVRRMGAVWKAVQRFVYLAVPLGLYHLFALGSTFTDRGAVPFRVAVLLTAVLALAQLAGALRGQARAFTALAAAVTFTAGSVLAAGGSGGIHGSHAAAMPHTTPPSLEQINVSFSLPDEIRAGQQAEIAVRMSEASTGRAVERFVPTYGKSNHVIVTDTSLRQFAHVHAEFRDGAFRLPYVFPTDGSYRVYFDFATVNRPEQVAAASVRVGPAPPAAPKPSAERLEDRLPDLVGRLTNAPFRVTALADGSQTVDALLSHVDGTPVADLGEYVGAYGHLTLINRATYAFVHLHPSLPLRAGYPAGPGLSFVAMATAGAVPSPGQYQAFLEVAPGGVYRLLTFTVTLR